MRPLVLDITRSLQRQARGAGTGIDRVEAAYIDTLDARYLYQSQQLWALLDAEGLARIWAERPRLDLTGRLAPWRARARRELEAALRRYAIWHNTGPLGIGQVIGGKWHFLNVGHTSPEADTLTHLRQEGMARLTVMIHDAIPILYPEWCNPKAAARYAQRLRAIGVHADQILYVSRPAQAEVEEILKGWGHVPPGQVCPPGIVLPDVTRAPERGRFLMLGTVEPRKNLGLLLDIWLDLAVEGALLDVIGHPGWNSAPLLDRCARTQGVTYHGPLSDRAVRAHLAHADALLFPSRAEGAGLPVGEALGIGLPVIANDLPCLRDLFGHGPKFVSAQNPADWHAAIRSHFREDNSGNQMPKTEKVEMSLPSWQTHFNVLERLLE
jgi:glycosyltransferase involved in cell wall biosynthesis